MDPQAQHLIELIWRWRQSGQAPSRPEEMLVVGLATCSPQLLSMADCADPVCAWGRLDPAELYAATRWWAHPPERTPKLEPGSAERVSAILLDPKQLREQRGESQKEFWHRLGVTQSGGARYENGRRLPPPMRILLALTALGWVTQTQLKCWGRICDGEASGLGEEVDRRIAGFLADPEAARLQRNEGQKVYWGRFGVTQSNGSVYESGRKVPRTLRLLLVGLWLGELDDAGLAEVRAVGGGGARIGGGTLTPSPKEKCP